MRPLQPWFAAEVEASRWLTAKLREVAPRARQVREVYVRHPLHAKLLRIDLVVVFPGFRPASPTPSLVGIEIKRKAESGVAEWKHALKQCLDYRMSVIADKRSTHYLEQRLDYAFAFPDPRDDPTWDRESYRGWAEGMERLAGMFSVGTIRVTPWGVLEFRCCADILWRSSQGAAGSAIWGSRHVRAGNVG